MAGEDDVEKLVALIADRVRARLGDAAPKKLPVLLRDIPCDNDTADGNDCKECGLCVVRRPWSVRAIQDAGAARVAAPQGTGQLPTDMAGMIDHTLLKADVTRDDIKKLCDEARKYRFASVCVNTTWVPVCRALLGGSGVMVCAVVGFPLGAMTPTAKAYEAREAVRQGAQEIDMVINIGALKSRDYETVFEDIARVVKSANPAKVKVILETGALNMEEKIIGITLSKLAGAAFVKTSTGFGPGGATVEDITLMRKLVGPDMGVKASGGVRTREDADKMALAGANRIGASASVSIVTNADTKQAASKGGYWMTAKRVILLVMDSVGCGEAPDAASYGDQGTNTLANTARKVGGLNLPMLQQLGLGNLTAIQGLPAATHAIGAFGKMEEASAGKDTTTGHWEMAGLRVEKPFALFPDGFPPEILDPFMARTGRGVLGNKPASGTVILDELAEEHVKTGKLIVYTSGDSVFQIAAHEDVVPIEELYKICKIAREILDPYYVGRVIARPFVGTGKGPWKRTYNRKDFSMVPPENTVLDSLAAAGFAVVGIGKIPDIYAGRGITEAVHSEGNADGLALTLQVMERVKSGLVFNNLVDFDMLYGHRNDPTGYARCLVEFDAFLPILAAKLEPGDLVLITADHGNDPTTVSTDHTREFVPILAFGPACAADKRLGTRKTFSDIAATLAENFGVAAPRFGKSFLSEIS